MDVSLAEQRHGSLSHGDARGWQGREAAQPSSQRGGKCLYFTAGAAGTGPIIAVLGGGFEGKAMTGSDCDKTVALLELIGALCLTSLGPRVSATQD